MASAQGIKWIDVSDTPYSNQHNTIANAFFLGLISLSLVGCIAASSKTQRAFPFSLALCLAYIFEITAYALRLQAWDFVKWSTNFGLSTIAPVFITISIHLATAPVIARLGPEHSPLSPNGHLRLTVWADILAGVLQAIGLSLTFAGARGAGPWGILLPANAYAGQTLIFTGLILQTLMLALAVGCLVVTYVRAGRAGRRYAKYTTTTTNNTFGGSTRTRGPAAPLSSRLKVFLAVLPLAGTCVLVRCAYRTAAAWGGIASDIARDEVLWLVAEGVLLTEAMVSLAVFHPAIWLDKDEHADAADAADENHKDRYGVYRYPDDDMEAIRASMLSKAKRYSAATTTMGSPAAGDVVDARVARRGSDPDHPEASQLIFSTHLIAPSDASGSRRGSAGEDDDAAAPRGRLATYADGPYEDVRMSEDITAEARAMDTSSSSDADDLEDRLEVDSVVLPSRKPSRREPGGDEGEDVALKSTYSQSVYSQ